MDDSVLVGRGNEITKIPRQDWEDEIFASAKELAAALSFMTEEHHRVRNFVVREMALRCEPLLPEIIARELNLSTDRAKVILDDLEKHLTFLFRDQRGAVTWAYPVTVDATPHHVKFISGEKLYAA